MTTEFEMFAQPMRLTRESVLQFSPDPGWEVRFTEPDNGKTHTLPMIGWAVAIGWTGYHVPEEDEATEKKANVETNIQPVVLADSGPQTLPLFLHDHMPGAKWHVVRAEA